eukprot:6479517-Amphidinium_carterae.1
MSNLDTSAAISAGKEKVMVESGLEWNRTKTRSTVKLLPASTVAATCSVRRWRFIAAITSGEHR